MGAWFSRVHPHTWFRFQMSIENHHGKREVGFFVVITERNAYLQDSLAFVLVPQTTLVSGENGLSEQTTTR